VTLSRSLRQLALAAVSIVATIGMSRPVSAQPEMRDGPAALTASGRPRGGAPRPVPVALAPAFATSASRATVAANGGNAFLLEALGGSVGSLVGIGLVGLTAACGVEDLACIIRKVGAAGALGVVGATVGTTLVARRTGSDRSAAGAAIGAIVGTGFALGTNWLLERANYELGRATIVPMVVLSQGTFAAAGSRLLGR
jgi:hypothetical protein